MFSNLVVYGKLLRCKRYEGKKQHILRFRSSFVDEAGDDRIFGVVSRLRKKSMKGLCAIALEWAK